MIEGVDISHWNTVTDWAKVAQTKRFAIIASGDGNYLDPQFGWNLLGAHQAGMKVDIYHYMRFGLSAQDQARICERRWAEARAIAPVARLWLDFEDVSSQASALTRGDRQAWLGSLLLALEDMAGDLGIYTGAWWWNERMGRCSDAERLPLWAASYGNLAILPLGWTNYAIWQYTSSGQVDGISGNVDLNRAKDGVFEEDDMDEATVKGIVDKALKPVLRGLELQAEAQDIRAGLEYWLATYGELGEDERFMAFVDAHIAWRLRGKPGWTVPA